MSNGYHGQTGPQSSAGKKIFSVNALKQGLFAKTIVLPFEDERQYKKHCQQVRASLEPQNSLELSITQQLLTAFGKTHG